MVDWLAMGFDPTAANAIVVALVVAVIAVLGVGLYFTRFRDPW